MSAQSRLTTAIEDGILPLPDGPITVLRPPAGYDVGGLTGHDVQVATGFYPDLKAWQDAGFDAGHDPKPAGMVIVVLPRSKVLARAMVAQACALGDIVVVDGFKTDGVESVFSSCRKVLDASGEEIVMRSMTKGHGRMFWFAAIDHFQDWAQAKVVVDGFTVQPGVFSDGGIDKGSRLLADSLPKKLPKRVADLGAGWGFLSTAILQRDGVEAVDLIEAEALALACAKINVVDPRASFHWADAATWQPRVKYDAVVMNPPFHTSRATDPSLGQGFISAAAGMLTPNGKMWMVANRHLPYEATLRDCFRHVEELPCQGGFKIFHAARPSR